MKPIQMKIKLTYNTIATINSAKQYTVQIEVKSAEGVVVCHSFYTFINQK